MGVCDDGDKAGAAADGAGEGDMRRVQIASCCKQIVGVDDDGDNAGGADDGACVSV